MENAIVDRNGLLDYGKTFSKKSLPRIEHTPIIGDLSKVDLGITFATKHDVKYIIDSAWCVVK